MKKIFAVLCLAISTQSFAGLVNLDINEFQKVFKSLNKEKGYNGEIKSSLSGNTEHEKFIVTGKAITDELEPVLMTGYYQISSDIDTIYSITEYRIYCDDETYGYALTTFDQNGEMSVLTSDSDYVFEYEDPTDRDRKFTKVLKNACKQASL